MYKGTIKRITDKGYGFIACPELKSDVFIHFRNCAPDVNLNDLQEGEEVQFDVEKKEKGYSALSLSRA